jgi:hypothetical protein
VIITVAQGLTLVVLSLFCKVFVRIASAYVFREDGNGNNTASNNLLRPYRKF